MSWNATASQKCVPWDPLWNFRNYTQQEIVSKISRNGEQSLPPFAQKYYTIEEAPHYHRGTVEASTSVLCDWGFEERHHRWWCPPWSPRSRQGVGWRQGQGCLPLRVLLWGHLQEVGTIRWLAVTEFLFDADRDVVDHIAGHLRTAELWNRFEFLHSVNHLIPNQYLNGIVSWEYFAGILKHDKYLVSIQYFALFCIRAIFRICILEATTVSWTCPGRFLYIHFVFIPGVRAILISCLIWFLRSRVSARSRTSRWSTSRTASSSASGPVSARSTRTATPARLLALPASPLWTTVRSPRRLISCPSTSLATKCAGVQVFCDAVSCWVRIWSWIPETIYACACLMICGGLERCGCERTGGESYVWETRKSCTVIERHLR